MFPLCRLAPNKYELVGLVIVKIWWSQNNYYELYADWGLSLRVWRVCSVRTDFIYSFKQPNYPWTFEFVISLVIIWYDLLFAVNTVTVLSPFLYFLQIPVFFCSCVFLYFFLSCNFLYFWWNMGFTHFCRVSCWKYRLIKQILMVINISF